MTQLTINQAAEIAGKSNRTIRRWIHDGKLQATLGKRGEMEEWYIDENDLAEFINKPTYDDLQTDNERLRREFLRLINLAERGNVGKGDITRAKNALIAPANVPKDS